MSRSDKHPVLTFPELRRNAVDAAFATPTILQDTLAGPRREPEVL